jgi:hypothetical protein
MPPRGCRVTSEATMLASLPVSAERGGQMQSPGMATMENSGRGQQERRYSSDEVAAVGSDRASADGQCNPQPLGVRDGWSPLASLAEASEIGGAAAVAIRTGGTRSDGPRWKSTRRLIGTQWRGLEKMHSQAQRGVGADSGTETFTDAVSGK